MDSYLNVTMLIFLAAAATYFGLFNAGSSSIFIQESSVDNVVSSAASRNIIIMATSKNVDTLLA